MALVTGDEFTKTVLKRWEDIPNPRLREVMQSAIKHLHAFVSEVKPTGAEWFKAIQFLTAIGHKCDDKRQEFILASDVMGVSMLVDDIKKRIDEAAKFVAHEQLCLSPQCGFASTEEGNVLTEEAQWNKMRMIKDLSREVWG